MSDPLSLFPEYRETVHIQHVQEPLIISIIQISAPHDLDRLSADVTPRNDTTEIIKYVSYSAVLLGAIGAMVGATRRDGERSTIQPRDSLRESLYLPIAVQPAASSDYVACHLTVRTHQFDRTLIAIRECDFHKCSDTIVFSGDANGQQTLNHHSIPISRGVADQDFRVMCRFGVLIVNPSPKYFERVTASWCLSDGAGDEIERGVESVIWVASQ